MSVISDFLKQILTAYYGKDVRQSIHDAIKQCYEDATGNPESVASVVKQNDDMKELLENTPYTTAESEGEFELPVHTINDSRIGDDSTWSSKKIIDAIYPVGAIYMSVNSTNPSTLLGGTWVAWGAGRVPVGVGTGKDSNETSKSFTNAEETAGEYTHKLTISEMPDHVHSVDALSLKKSGESSAQSGSGTFAFSGLVNTTSTDGMGDGNSHNNIQPYITCYMWKRTA